jgi:hypothetical protein
MTDHDTDHPTRGDTVYQPRHAGSDPAAFADRIMAALDAGHALIDLSEHDSHAALIRMHLRKLNP